MIVRYTRALSVLGEKCRVSTDSCMLMEAVYGIWLASQNQKSVFLRAVMNCKSIRVWNSFVVGMDRESVSIQVHEISLELRCI